MRSSIILIVRILAYECIVNTLESRTKKNTNTKRYNWSAKRITEKEDRKKKKEIKEILKETVIRSVLGERGMNRQNTENFQGSENTRWYLRINMDYYTFVQTHRM